MGNAPSAARQVLPVDATDPSFWDSSPALQAFRVEAQLPHGSGRMMRTFRLTHTTRQVTAIGKAFYVPTSLDISEQEEEIRRLRRLLSQHAHVAVWSLLSGETSVRLQNLWYRPVLLLRPHVVTTLRDRLASRPFFETVEQVWITTQLLQALEQLHRAGVVHGFLSTSNVGLTSTGWLVLLDLSSVYKPFVSMPDDDPSDYLLAFHSERCYLAPERFRRTMAANEEDSPNDMVTGLTPAMDVFAAGCVLVELFLNGERCMDLGDLMEYRRGNMAPVQQKLAKMEHASIRAACRHMLSLDPSERLSPGEYLQRLEAQEDIVPSTLARLTPLVEQATQTLTPDARIAMAAEAYGTIVWECMGERDAQGTNQCENMLGPDMKEPDKENARSEPPNSPTTVVGLDALLADTTSLLKELEAFHQGIHGPVPSDGKSSAAESQTAGPEVGAEATERSILCKKSLLIYLQLVLSNIRHVQRLASRLVALQIVRRLVRFFPDEVRLQRIVPVLVSLLHDQDPLVRASVVQILTMTLSLLESFSPSDSKLFPQYIFKRVHHLISDPSALVRIAFASCLGSLAESSLRFLDISHAVRLYEAAGSGTGTATPLEEASQREGTALFADDVVKLLDTSESAKAGGSSSSSKSGSHSAAGSTLISSTYAAELAGLHETISRWVVHIMTEQADDSAPAKRALLRNMANLCNFFGLEGVMSFILPQILAFLNDRRNWELRAALFDALPFVCRVMGRSSTEEYVLPCLEIGLIDMEELVVNRSLLCLRELLRMGLVSRGSIIGSDKMPSLLEQYGALIVHPSPLVRDAAIQTAAAACKAVGSTDCGVFLLKAIRPFLRFRPSPEKLMNPDALASIVQDPLPRVMYTEALQLITAQIQRSNNSIDDKGWTSIGVNARNKWCENDDVKSGPLASSIAAMPCYLNLLAHHTLQTKSGQLKRSSFQMDIGIEGSIKQAQSVMFPRQDCKTKQEVLPGWYNMLREAALNQKSFVTEVTAVRSVSMLGNIFGLSIMGPAAGTSVNIVDAADGGQNNEPELTHIELESLASRRIEASLRGQWGCETMIDPDLCDTTLLMTKLKALGVPPLAPDLGKPFSQASSSTVSSTLQGSSKPRQVVDSCPKILTAQSSRKNSHSSVVTRLAVAPDSSFFISSSYDGTCRVWETQQLEEATGIIECNLVYSGHSLSAGTRVNDVAMVEGSHSAVSGDSDGSVHVWRVDVESNAKARVESNQTLQTVRTTGTTIIRKLRQEEGEILAVSHFNSLSASVITYASQNGSIHSWDLRSTEEPFKLEHSPGLGYLTNVVLGSDRNWVVSGTSRGYVAFWDIRFQKAVKLWRHSRRAPISRLGTSMATPPQTWGADKPNREIKPFIFIAAGMNECSMFDVMSGKCNECFRVLSDNGEARSPVEALPELSEVMISSRHSNALALHSFNDEFDSARKHQPILDTINALVGSVGGSGRHSYLISGGSDSKIRCWDFALPSQCYVLNAFPKKSRTTFERIDINEEQRLMICRQSLTVRGANYDLSNLPNLDMSSTESIQDLKFFEKQAESYLVSGGRDSVIRIYS